MVTAHGVSFTTGIVLARSSLETLSPSFMVLEQYLMSNVQVTVPLPAGYTIDTVLEKTGGYLIKWLVPGGEPVYVAVLAKPEALSEDIFWTDMLAHVQDYVTISGRNPIRATPRMAIMRKPPELLNGTFQSPFFDATKGEDGSYSF